MYVNKRRIKAGETTVLKEQDEICFGSRVSRNELKYIFSLKDGKAALEKIADSLLHNSSKENDNKTIPLCRGSVKRGKSITPPLIKRQKTDTQLSSSKKLDFSNIQPSSDHSTTKTPPPKASALVSPLQNVPIPPTKAQVLPEPTAPVLNSSPKIPDLISSPKTPILPSPKASALVSPLQNVPITPTKAQVLPEPTAPVLNSSPKIPDDLISSPKTPIPSYKTVSGLTIDDTTMKVLAAQDKMEQEKNELLCSIEDLKNELAAKNDLIAASKESDENSEKKEDESIVSSMQEEFTCTICQELFIRSYTLPCAHSFCECCIKEWMKTKRQKDCPICRKQITSEPVHSLVLDNVISKMEAKLSKSEKEERERTKEQHKKFLGVIRATPNLSVDGLSTNIGSNRNNAIIIGSPPQGFRNGNYYQVNNYVHSFEYSFDEEDFDEENSDEEDSDEDEVYGYRSHGRCYHCGKYIYLIVEYRLLISFLVG